MDLTAAAAKEGVKKMLPGRTVLDMLGSARKAVAIAEDELDECDEEIPETDSDQSVELLPKKQAAAVQEDEELIKRLAARRATLHAELEDTLKELNKNAEMMKIMTDFRDGVPLSPIPFVDPPKYEPCGQDFESDEIQDEPENIPAPPSPQPVLPVHELSDEDKTEHDHSDPDSPEYSDDDSATDSDYTIRHFPDSLYKKFITAGKVYSNDEVIAAAKTLRDFDQSPFDVFTKNTRWIKRCKYEFQLRQQRSATATTADEERRRKKRARVSSSADVAAACPHLMHRHY